MTSPLHGPAPARSTPVRQVDAPNLASTPPQETPASPVPAPQAPATREPAPGSTVRATRKRAVAAESARKERVAGSAATRAAASRELRPLEPARISWGNRRQLNDNHPEILSRYTPERAITSSTMPPQGTAHPGAHQNQAINGEGSIFSSHQNRTGRELHQNLLLHNPTDKPVRVQVSALASTTTREAPYRDTTTKPTAATATRPDPSGTLGNGPGDRTADLVLRGHREGPASITIPPHGTAVLHSASHPKGVELVTQAQFKTDGPVNAAVAYSTTPLANDKTGHSAKAAEILRTSDLVARDPKHDKIPSPPGDGRFIYGRVAGMVEGSNGTATLTNDNGNKRFITDRPGTQEFAFLTKTTRNVDGYDSAGRMLSRYPDSAYKNHGNYGADLTVSLPLHNPANAPGPRRVRVYFDTPPEQNNGGVSRSIRNSVAATAGGTTRYFNLNQQAGSRSQTPLVDVTLKPGQSMDAALRMVNAANNTPPHTIRVVTEDAAAR